MVNGFGFLKHHPCAGLLILPSKNPVVNIEKLQQAMTSFCVMTNQHI